MDRIAARKITGETRDTKISDKRQRAFNKDEQDALTLAGSDFFIPAIQFKTDKIVSHISEKPILNFLAV